MVRSMKTNGVKENAEPSKLTTIRTVHFQVQCSLCKRLMVTRAFREHLKNVHGRTCVETYMRVGTEVSILLMVLTELL